MSSLLARDLAGPEPREKKLSWLRLHPAYWQPRHARTGFADLTFIFQFILDEKLYGFISTFPKPPKQISEILIPASILPLATMPESIKVLSKGPLYTFKPYFCLLSISSLMRWSVFSFKL